MKIISYKERTDRWNVFHEAIIETTEKIENEKDFVEEIAIQVGRHPAGYGCERPSVKKITGNQYKITWHGYSHCD